MTRLLRCAAVSKEMTSMSPLKFKNGPRSTFEREVSRWLTPGGVAESLCGNQRERRGVLRPQSVADVQRILYAASKAAGAVMIQPVSCGRNWGFGSDLFLRLIWLNA